MDAASVFAKGLQQLRKQRSLTQMELAEAAGLSVQMIAALEQGGKTPSMATIDRLCEALRVRFSELIAAGELKSASSDEPPQRVADSLRGLSKRQQAEVAEIVVRLCKVIRHGTRR